MSEIKNNIEKAENKSNKPTINILTKNTVKLTDFNIYEIRIDQSIMVSKHLEKFKKKSSKILLIKKTSNWCKYLRNKKKNFYQKK